MTKYQWDITCANRELKRIQRGFTEEDHASFAAVLLAGYIRVQSAAHVETGRLRASGSSDVTRSTARAWHGHMSFGGQGVPYAASEFFGYSPRHGGYPSHAYYRGVGWQPTPRGFTSNGDVPWSQLPVRDAPGTSGIQDEMIEPVGAFITRGKLTPHTHDCPPASP